MTTRTLPQRTLPQPSITDYAPDPLSVARTIVGLVGAALTGGVMTLVCWLILKTTHLPAFSASYVSRAAATALSVLVLVTVLTFVYLWLQDEHAQKHGLNTTRSRFRQALTYALCYLSPAGLVVSTLAVPLSATKLYLDGISVDQGFRTQYLTRLTDTAHLTDMNYANLPPFYPAGWFWFGGRFAKLLGLPGWEAFQPWALITIAAAGCVLVPVWQHITASLPVGTAVALVTTVVTLVLSSYEPYAAIIAMGAPAAAILARRALDGARLAGLGLIIYLGVSASMYTLFTGVIAISIVLLACCMAVMNRRSLVPLLRLAVIGIGSVLIALVVWAPYLLAVAHGKPRSSSSATHYLPQEGTEIPLPMFSFSFIGAACLIGIIFLVLRAHDRDVRALGLSLVVFYGWSVASMIATLAGTTLLGFRLDTLITLQLATAGVLGVAELRLVGVNSLYPQQLSPTIKRGITLIMVIVLGFAGVYYTQDIPNKLSHGINLAYSDTDGNGERADRTAPNSAVYYKDIDTLVRDTLGRPARDIQVLTDEFSFLSYYPYHGYQGLTAHYANPLGLFEQRNDVIEGWSSMSYDKHTTPQSLAAAMDSSPFGAPDVLILHGYLPGEKTSAGISAASAAKEADKTGSSTGSSGDENPSANGSARTSSVEKSDDEAWTYDIAEDIYPNSPNVRFRQTRFNPHAFMGSNAPWVVQQIGPFVVIIRR